MTWWVGYLEDHPTYRYFLLIGVISHLFISLCIFIFMYIYLFLFKFMYIYLFLFIYISMYLFFLLSFFIFFSCLFIYLFIFLFIYIQYIYIYLCIQDTNFRLTTTKLFTSYAPLDDSPKFSSWFWHFARERKTNCWSRWPCCAARHRGVVSSATYWVVQWKLIYIYMCVCVIFCYFIKDMW